MSKLTLDVNGLSVESFSVQDAAAAAVEPTTGTMTYTFCLENGTGAATYVSCIVDQAGGDALTEGYPCKTTR